MEEEEKGKMRNEGRRREEKDEKWREERKRMRGWERSGEGGERKGMKRRENMNRDERRNKKEKGEKKREGREEMRRDGTRRDGKTNCEFKQGHRKGSAESELYIENLEEGNDKVKRDV